MFAVNYLAVVVAALASFMLGWALVFATAASSRGWRKLARRRRRCSEETQHDAVVRYRAGHVIARVMGDGVDADSARSPLAATRCHARFCGGILLGRGQFRLELRVEGKSFRLWLINGWYYVAQFTLMGAILGVMNT